MDTGTDELDAEGLLRAWRGGDMAARDRLFALFYAELRQAAAAMLRAEHQVSLSPSDLLHEAATRLIGLDRIDWADRAHFRALATRMLRRALIDHVRAKRRDKRDHLKVALVTNIPEVPNLDLEEVDEALGRLALLDEQRARIVEMRFFGGMDIAEIAHELQLSEATVKRRWSGARLWLLDALSK